MGLRCAVLIFTLLAAASLTVAGSGAPRSAAPPDPLLIRSAKFQSRQKPAVPFNHSLHQQKGVSCAACHHDYRGGRNVWREGLPVPACGDCHGRFPQGRQPDLKNAYHRQCKTCHLQRRQAGRPAGPVKCTDCHRSG